MKGFLRAAKVIGGTCLVLFAFLALLGGLRYLVVGKKSLGSNYVGVIELDGVILQSKEILEELEEAENTAGLKAVVFRVNSPGGLVPPSEEIYRQLRKLDEKIPVVVSMGSVGASGGYLVSLGGRKIFANGGTLTGSIGVILELINTEKLLQWAKVERYSLKSGKFKEAGASYRKMTPEERELLQGMVDNLFDQFRSVVSERRGLKGSALAAVTDGRVFTGLQAKEAKLIDEIGGLQDAVKAAKKLAGLPEDAPVEYPKDKEGLLKKVLLGTRNMLQSFESFFSQQNLTTPRWRVLFLAPVG